MRDALSHSALPSSVKNAFIGHVPNTSRSAPRWLCGLVAASALAGACGNETVDDLFTSKDPSLGGGAPSVRPDAAGTGGAPIALPSPPSTGGTLASGDGGEPSRPCEAPAGGENAAPIDATGGTAPAA